jgi:Zn-dependent peptidase ImmA (M78 family)
MLNLTSLKSDRFLVERISKLIPDWGIRQLSLDALGNYCDQNGIVVFEVPLSEADGYAFYQGDIPHLFFNAKLNYAERVISAYHELAHLLLHTPDPEVFRRQKYS